jgi:hypothetical protein
LAGALPFFFLKGRGLPTLIMLLTCLECCAEFLAIFYPNSLIKIKARAGRPSRAMANPHTMPLMTDPTSLIIDSQEFFSDITSPFEPLV